MWQETCNIHVISYYVYLHVHVRVCVHIHVLILRRKFELILIKIDFLKVLKNWTRVLVHVHGLWPNSPFL